MAPSLTYNAAHTANSRLRITCPICTLQSLTRFKYQNSTASLEFQWQWCRRLHSISINLPHIMCPHNHVRACSVCGTRHLEQLYMQHTHIHTHTHTSTHSHTNTYISTHTTSTHIHMHTCSLHTHIPSARPRGGPSLRSAVSSRSQCGRLQAQQPRG